MTFDPQPFNALMSIGMWAAVVGAIVAFLLVLLMPTLLVVHGVSGPANLFREIAAGFRDWRGTSWQRVIALTVLTFRQAVRRKTFVVGIVFALLFMFAGWFISDANPRPDLQIKVHLTFVLTSISWLIIPVVLLLSCWSLPEDIKDRSLHTVVTKPVRRNEIVLGRMLGFLAIGTVAVVLMGLAGYVWINRQIPADAKANLIARVPLFGRLGWVDRSGRQASSGVNTGDMWEFRSYIEGNTKARAIWDFENLDTTRAGDVLRLQSSFQVFRTHKGEDEKGVVQGVLAQFVFINEEKGLRVPYKAFPVKEFRDGGNSHDIHRTLTYQGGEQNKVQTVDLFDDLVTEDGKLRIEVQCLSSGQYLGMARPDLFIRLPEGLFFLSYTKAVFGIWMMMGMTVVLGVMMSCLAKGPVAALATLVVLALGKTATVFMSDLVAGMNHAGGPIESFVRLALHLNSLVALEAGTMTTIVKVLDGVILHMLWVCTLMIPDFRTYDMTGYVANGFDVPFSAAILKGLATTVGYTIPWVIVAYYAIKLRELETK